MKSSGFFTVAFLTFSIISFQSATPEYSISPSGQFVVSAGNVRLRGALSGLAEQTKMDLLGILRRQDDWKIPIVIHLQSSAVNLPETPSTAFRFSQTDSGPKLQLDLTIGERIDAQRVEQELMRAILLEMIYRKQTSPAVGQDYIEPPPWLVDGLLAALPNCDTPPLKEALEINDRPSSLEKILRIRPELLDSTGQLLYRAYSFALVQQLIQSGGGRERISRYIENLSFASNDPLADFDKAFPDLLQTPEIWKRRIAAIAKPTGLLSFSRSEEKLAELLQRRFPADKGRSLSLEELCDEKLNRVQELALQKLVQDLMLFGERANPVLRPVVQSYQQTVAQLALGKNRAARVQLMQLKRLHARLSARMREVDDYLNWFEATQLNRPSGAFDNQDESSKKTREYRRQDPLSLYLDAVEEQN